MQKAQSGDFKVECERFNLRGVLRHDGGTIKKFVADICKSPNEFRTSSAAMRRIKGLSITSTGVAQAAPVERIECDPMQGLCLRSDNSSDEPDLVPCFRIYLLVKGAVESGLDPLDANITDMRTPTCCVTSQRTKCLLSTEGDVRIDLTCYCNFNSMLTYRLDKQSALISVSNVQQGSDAIKRLSDIWVRFRSMSLKL